jgi:hypothetical protein
MSSTCGKVMMTGTEEDVAKRGSWRRMSQRSLEVYVQWPGGSEAKICGAASGFFLFTYRAFIQMILFIYT